MLLLDPPETARALTRPPLRHAVTVIGIAVLMSCLFVASYSLALGRPSPHHIPAGVVGDQGTHPALVVALGLTTRGAMELRPYPTRAAAEHALAEQEIYAVLDLRPARPQLQLSSASGTSVARVLEQSANAVAVTRAGPLVVRDLHPLPAGDPQGLVAFYATLAATVLGFVTMFQLRANAPALSLRGWWGCIGLVVAAGATLLTLVLGPIIGALDTPLWELWLALAGQIAIAALFNATMITLVGRWAILPTWGFFVAFGNASSGGAVSPPLLPRFFAVVSRFLPAGAAIETIRNATYFQGHQHLEPVLVQCAWVLGTAASFTLAARLRGRAPGES